MPPERLAGGQGDAPAPDQYAYCVACWEALLGARPPARSPGRRVPAWLRRALERGLASDAKRWPAMAPLLAALKRGRTRARLRSAAVALPASVALLAGGAEGYRRWDLAERAATHARELAGARPPATTPARPSTRSGTTPPAPASPAAFTATGLGYASTTATHVMP